MLRKSIYSLNSKPQLDFKIFALSNFSKSLTVRTSFVHSLLHETLQTFPTKTIDEYSFGEATQLLIWSYLIHNTIFSFLKQGKGLENKMSGTWMSS